MAEEHNALKYGPSISQAAAIAFGGAYGDVGISRLSESLTATADLWRMPEWALLRGEILFCRIPATIPAVAARFSSLELVNAATNTKLAVVRGIQNFTGATMEYNVEPGGAIAANPVVSRGKALDGRFPQLGEVSTCVITTGDVVAGIVAPTNALVQSAAALMMPIPPLIVPPGFKVFFINPTANTANRISVFWSERSPFPGELRARG